MNTEQDQATQAAQVAQAAETQKADQVVADTAINEAEEVSQGTVEEESQDNFVDGVVDTDDDGNVMVSSFDDLGIDGDDDDYDDYDETDSIVDASEDLSLPTGDYIWSIGAYSPNLMTWTTKKDENGVTVRDKLYSAGVIIRVHYDLGKQEAVEESFIQTFYFITKKTGLRNKLGLSQARSFVGKVLAAYENDTRESVLAELQAERVGNARIFRELLPREDDDQFMLTSRIQRKEGKGEYKGVFNNQLPNTAKVREANDLYEASVDE